MESASDGCLCNAAAIDQGDWCMWCGLEIQAKIRGSLRKLRELLLHTIRRYFWNGEPSLDMVYRLMNHAGGNEENFETS